MSQILFEPTSVGKNYDSAEVKPFDLNGFKQWQTGISSVETVSFETVVGSDWKVLKAGEQGGWIEICYPSSTEKKGINAFVPINTCLDCENTSNGTIKTLRHDWAQVPVGTVAPVNEQGQHNMLQPVQGG